MADYSLWPACVRTHDFRDQLVAAATAGFNRLPIGGMTVRKLQSRGMTLGDIRNLACESGVRIGHYDGFTDWAPQRYASGLIEDAKAVFDFSVEECLEICDGLDIDAICATGAFEPGRFPVSVLADHFAHFCERAARLNIRVELEFIPMWSIPSLSAAWEIVRLSGAKNAGILLDTWHFCRGDADFALLENLPCGAITCLQLADATQVIPQRPLIEECLRFRRPPGEGNLPLGKILAILAAKGGVKDVGPEVFSDELDTCAATEAARRVFEATSLVLPKNREGIDRF